MTRVSERHRRVPHAYRAPPPPPPPAYVALPALPALPLLPPLELDLDLLSGSDESDADSPRPSSSSETRDTGAPRRRAPPPPLATAEADASKETLYRSFVADGISSGQYSREECLRELKRLVSELETACKKRGTLPGAEADAATKQRRRLTTVDE